ncbi:GNAT family N-acetyltransferase [Streptomyces antioxidans]|uniref:GNAT family N-acetyltransferase n=1 Tax=Streptomyces antioxidans TaxID=1507734 RepID=A0A1V4D372_9ACTN|nr:GNAT family N-acetyltransferase [Streptomyces antioxidans]OPF78045.1 GNAT family N-acetyltransferase [Streptomyces antioxidans]
MRTELRVLDPSVWDDWYGNLLLAFGGVPEAPEKSALWRELTECERSIGAWDGADIVGTASLYSFRLSVPGGGIVPAAGVTMVSVRATHRRRGVLRAMMRRQLDDIRAAGDEPLAVLTASEPDIYGRFGYGAATQTAYAEIDTAKVRLTVPEGTDGVRLRAVPLESAVEACEAVYARRVRARPGMLERTPGWERVPLLDPPGDRKGASPLRCVLAESGGGVTGYARFAVKPDWDLAGPKGEVVLRDLEALDPASYAALWRFLFDLDLTSVIRTGPRPVDDPWQLLVSDIRRCAVRLRDSLYVRLVDVGAALEARTYTTPVETVLEVTDPLCPWNEGRWRLSGDAKGASCERTDDSPDLRLGVRELGAAYLGGVPLTALAGAGRVQEAREGALTEATNAFATPVAPWLPHAF